MSESCVCDGSVEFALIRGLNHTHPEDTADWTNLIKHVCEIRIKCVYITVLVSLFLLSVFLTHAVISASAFSLNEEINT